jgi:hypothetical protein
MYWLIFGAILCTWTLLRLLGSERQMRLRVLRESLANEMQNAPAARPAPGASAAQAVLAHAPNASSSGSH